MDLIDKLLKDKRKQKFYRNFVSAFKEMKDSGNLSDFLIIGGEEAKEFAVHKIVLAAQSSVFATVFKNDMMESQTGKMVIDDFSAGTIQEMLHFMYSGDIKDEDNAMDLYVIANKYDVIALKEVTEDIILRNTNQSNAIEVYGLGLFHNSKEMKRAALTIIEKIIPDAELSEEIMEQPENLKLLKEYVEVRRKWLEVAAKIYKKANP